MSTTQRYLTIAQAADRLGVCTKTIRRNIATGRLTGYRLGSQILRLDPAEVDSLLRPVPNARTTR